MLTSGVLRGRDSTRFGSMLMLQDLFQNNMPKELEWRKGFEKAGAIRKAVDMLRGDDTKFRWRAAKLCWSMAFNCFITQMHIIQAGMLYLTN